jgi:hypothetical protein
MAIRHKGRTIALVVVVVLIAGAGFGYWWVFVRKDQEPVDVAEVERNFEPGSRGGTAREGEPTPGVYLYDTSGTESVSALGGQTNTYPKTTTLTVTDTPCGVDARWDIATGRYDVDSRCRTAAGAWTLTRSVVSDRFFNQTQVDTSTCADVVELAADPTPGSRTSGLCTRCEILSDIVF